MCVSRKEEGHHLPASQRGNALLKLVLGENTNNGRPKMPCPNMLLKLGYSPPSKQRAFAVPLNAFEYFFFLSCFFVVTTLSFSGPLVSLLHACCMYVSISKKQS